MLIFQHNNLKANEWMGIRRELAQALQKTDETELAAGRSASGLSSSNIKLQTIQVSIFEAAMRVVEAWDPVKPGHAQSDAAGCPPPLPSDPATQSSTDAVANATPAPADPSFTHALSRAAYEAGLPRKFRHELAPLLNGPVALLTFPAVAPAHLKAALSILAPKAPAFPAPTRRASPGYHDAAVQAGLQKLVLLGARIEGKVFDFEKVRWLGGIEGGMEGLRAQLVAMLQGVGAGITSALEGAGRSLYFTIEGRKGMLEDKENGEGGQGPRDGP